MELKVAFVIVCLCALTITSTEAGIPNCCIAVRKIPHHMLRRVQCWKEQSDTGPCDISALILHMRGIKNKVCAALNMKSFLAKKKLNKLQETC